jgi:electron transport complex protein RnfC
VGDLEPFRGIGPDGNVAPAALRLPDTAARLSEALGTRDTAQLADVIDILRTSGVAAERWTSPDLLGQLEQAAARAPDIILCSTLDFDDALPLQETIAGTLPLELIAGVALLAAATAAKHAAVCFGTQIDETAPRSVKQAARGTGVRIERLVNDYPQPNPTLLLHALLNRRLRPGDLPTEAGVLLLDAAAAVCVGRTLLRREISQQVLLGLTDLRGATSTHPDATRSTRPARFIAVPAGARMSDVLGAAEIAPGPFELRAGSPLREVKLSRESTVTVAGELALYLIDPHPQPNPDPCIRCGWCVTGCPVNINPAGILQAAQAGDPVAADRSGIESCIECGICSYVCPSYLPLLDGIRSMRAGQGQNRETVAHR